MNEDQTLHGMGIDDAYRVERVLASGPCGTTERVTLDGAGPFIRKRMLRSRANRAVWAALASNPSARLPHVVASYELPDQFVVVYDFVPGETVAEWVTQNGRVDRARAACIIREVCEAASALARLSIVHCDISPTNVVVAADGAHLIDLGIARMMGEESAVPKALGTWGFASPEQHGFAAPDTRSDIYSIGRLLGYMLTGVDPADEAYTAALESDELVPTPLRRVVAVATAFEPSARFSTIGAFVHALDVAVEKIDGTAAPAHTVPYEPVHQQPSYDELVQSWRTDATKGSLGKPLNPKRMLIALGCAAVIIAGSVGVGLWMAHDATRDKDAVTGQKAQPEAEGTTNTSFDLPGTNVFTDSDDELLTRAAGSLELVESGWSVNEAGYIDYGFILRNTSDDLLIQLPEVTITGRASDGTILFTDTQMLNSVYPGQNVACGSQAGNGTPPDTVSFSVGRPKAYNVTTATGPVWEFAATASEVPNDLGYAIVTGEVSLVSTGDDVWMSGVAVTALLRDASGAIVSGAMSFVDVPTADKTVPYEVTFIDAPDHASVEVYVQLW